MSQNYDKYCFFGEAFALYYFYFILPYQRLTSLYLPFDMIVENIHDYKRIQRYKVR